jgi:2-polyprenyl-3-methyl-5-hydroxy-6-metoxy-1,4-benzoquinol methylase
MTEAALTERQQRERAFYEEYSRLTASEEVSFDPITGGERRPWNSYWYVYELAIENFKATGQKLLDFGCGPGKHSLRYAKIGYDVYGFDISPSNVAIAEHLAEKYDLKRRTHFSVNSAEALDYPADFFDVVIGIDILHHVDIKDALKECMRVLKPGGLIIFHEPVEVPLFDRLRKTRLIRKFVPTEASFDRHITEDERKLTPSDLAEIKSYGSSAQARRFLLTARLDRFIRDGNDPGASSLEKADHKIFKLLPFTKVFGGVIVLTMAK